MASNNLTNVGDDGFKEYMGLDKKRGICRACTDPDCIDCQSDYSTCTECPDGYEDPMFL